MVVDGPSGIGITALLEAARRSFARSGDVVMVRVSDVEAELPFASAVAIVEQLAAINRRHVRPDVKGAATDLLDVLLAASSAPTAPLTVLHQAFDVVRRTAAGHPLALFVDDAHWLDRSSAQMLAYLSSRLTGMEVLLAVGMRHEPGKHQPDALARVRANASITLSLDPLTAPAIADLLESEAVRTGDADRASNDHRGPAEHPR